MIIIVGENSIIQMFLLINTFAEISIFIILGRNFITTLFKEKFNLVLLLRYSPKRVLLELNPFKGQIMMYSYDWSCYLGSHF